MNYSDSTFVDSTSGRALIANPEYIRIEDQEEAYTTAAGSVMAEGEV